MSIEPVSCFFYNEYESRNGDCEYLPSKESYLSFQLKLNKADNENESEYDELLEWPGGCETEVDDNFFVCENHIHLITCDECGKLLTRQQISNYLNSDGDYNHLNEGLCVGPAGCTDCWVKYDNELRCELEIDSEKQEEEEEPDYPPMAIPKPKGRWDHQLTLEDLKNHANEITKRRIQEENVKYGLAFCSSETKDKSIKKLREYLLNHPTPVYLDKDGDDVVERFRKYAAGLPPLPPSPEPEEL